MEEMGIDWSWGGGGRWVRAGMNIFCIVSRHCVRQKICIFLLENICIFLGAEENMLNICLDRFFQEDMFVSDK